MNNSTQISNAIIEMLKLRGELKLLPQIIENLSKEIKLLQQEVIVESALELNNQELKQIRNTIAEKIGYQPQITNIIKPQLIAGIKIRLGDHVIDVSLKNRLEQLKNIVH